MSAKNLREIPVGGLFRWANPEPSEAGAVYRVIAGTEPGKDRVTAEAVNTGMAISPQSVYSGGEQVETI
jgi:hypothetical protein